MKITSTLLGAATAVALGGCVTTLDQGLHQGLQTDEALAVRQMISERCVVGRITAGKPRAVVFIREGVDSLRVDPPPLRFRHPVGVGEITIYSVREVAGGWKIYDATSGKVRDNFYLHSKTGSFACSEHEWLAGGGTRPQKTLFQRAGTPGLTIGQ